MSERRDALLEQLDRDVSRMLAGGDFARWLTARRAHRQYSFRNRMLIFAARPDATRVMSFRTWLKFGRVVAKGQHAIWILGPVKRKRIEADGTERLRVVAFTGVPVFDIAQTEALPPKPSGQPYLPLEPPPAPPTVCDPESADEAERALSGALDPADVTVSYHQDHGQSHDGRYLLDAKAIEVIARHTRVDQLGTLIHELAHHHGASYETHGRAGAEVIAEGAAWICLSELGMPTPSSPRYIAAYASTVDAHAVTKLAAQIDAIADRILAPLAEGDQGDRPREEPDDDEALAA